MSLERDLGVEGGGDQLVANEFGGDVLIAVVRENLLLGVSSVGTVDSKLQLSRSRLIVSHRLEMVAVGGAIGVVVMVAIGMSVSMAIGVAVGMMAVSGGNIRICNRSHDMKKKGVKSAV